jgi:hypothetical protein
VPDITLIAETGRIQSCSLTDFEWARPLNPWCAGYDGEFAFDPGGALGRPSGAR